MSTIVSRSLPILRDPGPLGQSSVQVTLSLVDTADWTGGTRDLR